jgi:succinyl-diaminopimelate desuccinylase
MSTPRPSPFLDHARADFDSVLTLTRDLVRIPTRGGIDPYDEAIDLLTTWLGERRLSPGCYGTAPVPPSPSLRASAGVGVGRMPGHRPCR